MEGGFYRFLFYGEQGEECDEEMVCLVKGKEGDEIRDQQGSHQQDVSEVDSRRRQRDRQDQEECEQLKQNQPHCLSDHEDGGRDGVETCPLQNKMNYKRDRCSKVTTEP